ncbi:MAG: MBL fold metallo-hydrolase [Solirubrobacteraceae bacterium]|jgi:N-acyl homoserine lactone hydrolase
MKIHPIQTGTVSVKHSFLFPSHGARRQLDLFMPGAWSEPLPIHCWAIEHDGLLRLVDTGETAAARDVPFARFEVAREQELPAAMIAAGVRLDDVSEVVLTHAHGDHIDGLVQCARG